MRRASVRLRLTALVALVFAGVAVLSSVLLVRAVRDSLEDEVAEAELARLQAVAAVMADPAGRPPGGLPGLPVPVVVATADGPVAAGLDPTVAFEAAAAAEAPFVIIGGPGAGAWEEALDGTEPSPGPGDVVVPLQLAVREPPPWLDAAELQGRSVTAVPVSTASGTVDLVAVSPLAGVRSSVDAVTRGLLVAIPMLVVMVAAIAWWLTGRALRPVAAMTARVEEISASTLHERVPVPPAHDEVGRLARTMNAMLDRLEEASDRQRRFTSDASHELRSPVAAIRAQVEVALLHPDAADWPAVARTVLDEDDRLEAIVADLLSLARLDEGRQRRAEVDLDDVVRAEAARPRRLPVDVADVAPTQVVGDEAGLRRLVRHLVDNAARHATARVAVSLATDTDTDGDGGISSVRLVVDDDGPGIPEDERRAVFERFHRLEEGRARDDGGAGLGLAVVAAVAASHGGTAVVAASPLGGARVEVVLPIGSATLPVPARP